MYFMDALHLAANHTEVLALSEKRKGDDKIQLKMENGQ